MHRTVCLLQSSTPTAQMPPIASTTLLSVGAALLVHHGWKHARDDPATSNAQRESCALVCYFQPKDIAHFETWIVVCLTNAIAAGPFLAQILCAVAAFLLLVLVMTNVVLCVAKQHAGRLENLEEPDDSKPAPNAGVIQSVVHNLSNHETWILVCFTNAARLWQ